MKIDRKLLDEIKNKAEADRTPVEIALLEAATSSAETDTTDGIDWKKAFDHPRFKELVVKASKAEEELSALKKQQEQREVEELAKQNQYKTLYEKATADLEAERTKSSKADTYEGILKKTLEAELGVLHPDAKKLVPTALSVEQQLEWISENRTLLARTKTQDIGGGRRSLVNGKVKSAELSPEEDAVRRSFGYSVEEYIKFRDMGSSTAAGKVNNVWQNTTSSADEEELQEE